MKFWQRLFTAFLQRFHLMRFFGRNRSFKELHQSSYARRRTFANMLKYIKMTASSNFGNVFSVLIASAFIPFLPMLPIHLLIQNLLYDVSQIVIPFDNVDEELIAKPQRWQPEEVGRFMVVFGPISSIFDIRYKIGRASCRERV